LVPSQLVTCMHGRVAVHKRLLSAHALGACVGLKQVAADVRPCTLRDGTVPCSIKQTHLFFLASILHCLLLGVYPYLVLCTAASPLQRLRPCGCAFQHRMSEVLDCTTHRPTPCLAPAMPCKDCCPHILTAPMLADISVLQAIAYAKNQPESQRHLSLQLGINEVGLSGSTGSSSTYDPRLFVARNMRIQVCVRVGSVVVWTAPSALIICF
jgi:hypothetical protein